MPLSPNSRRRFLRTAGAGAALTPLLTLPAGAAPASPGAPRPGRPFTSKPVLTWLGTAGWRVDIGERTVLVDPFLTRFSTGLFTGAFNTRTPLSVDPAAVAGPIGSPELVLVTHTHWDHFADVPHICTTTGARLVGTMTTFQLAQSMGVPVAQLSPVRGGEVFEFDDWTVEVFSSLHSRNSRYSVLFPGDRTAPLTAPPATIGDLPEGDTLAFDISLRDGPSVFFMGASDFNARHLSGYRPDIAMIAVTSSDATHDYLGRLLDTIGRPRLIVPIHWDLFEAPLTNPPPASADGAARLDAFVAAAKRIAPRSTVLVPDYLTPYTLPS